MAKQTIQPPLTKKPKEHYSLLAAAKKCEADPNLVRTLIIERRIPVATYGRKGRRVLLPASMAILREALRDHKTRGFTDAK